MYVGTFVSTPTQTTYAEQTTHVISTILLYCTTCIMTLARFTTLT